MIAIDQELQQYGNPELLGYPPTASIGPSTVAPLIPSTSAIPASLPPAPPTAPPASLDPALPPEPKVSLPRARTEPLPSNPVITSLPQRAQTAPPDVSKNTLTARRCTNKDASPSSFVKFMDVPVTMTREHIHDCLKDNRKWSTVNISNMEIFAIKNKESTIVNVLKIKFKDDAQSTTAKRVLTTILVAATWSSLDFVVVPTCFDVESLVVDISFIAISLVAVSLVLVGQYLNYLLSALPSSLSHLSQSDDLSTLSEPFTTYYCRHPTRLSRSTIQRLLSYLLSTLVYYCRQGNPLGSLPPSLKSHTLRPSQDSLVRINDLKKMPTMVSLYEIQLVHTLQTSRKHHQTSSNIGKHRPNTETMHKATATKQRDNNSVNNGQSP
ncbi:hypothetical protein JOM56_013787 [Amanita muscaria]